jgi:hypothetical protein
MQGKIDTKMPEISRFYGIIIAMFYDDHNPPHFHARYGKASVAIGIDSLRVLEGGILHRALGLTMEWASQHQKKLLNKLEPGKEEQAAEEHHAFGIDGGRQ